MASSSRKHYLRQRFAATQQARFVPIKTRSLSALKEVQVMEIAAAILFCSVVIWFVEEAADEHI
jgi:hypothetical protein